MSYLYNSHPRVTKLFTLGSGCILVVSAWLLGDSDLQVRTQTPSAQSALPRMPLTFVPVPRDGIDLARVDGPTSRFQAHAPGMAFFFETGAVQLLPSANPPSLGSIAGVSVIGTEYSEAVAEQPRGVTLRFLGSAPTTRLRGGTQLQGKVSYLLGNDPGSWSTNLPTFSSITYNGLYKGTSLTYAWEGNRLKGTYTLSRGADPEVLHWRYEDAQAVELDGGSLVITLHATCGETIPARLTEAAPVAWQDIEG